MRKTAWIILGIMAALLFPVTHRAHGETYTLGQAYSMALQKNEKIRIAQDDVRFAEQDRKRAVSTVLPKVTMSGTYDRFPEEAIAFGQSSVILQPQSAYGGEIKVEQPLFSGGKNIAGLKIAKSQVEVARKNLDLSSEALLIQVAQAYYGILQDRKNLEAQERNVERLAEHRRLSELRFKVGEVTEAVLLRSEAELAGARADLIARERDLAVKKREMQTLTDLPDGFEITEPSLPEMPGDNLPVLLEAANGNREDLQQSLVQQKISEEHVTFSRGNFFPTLSLSGSVFSRQQQPTSTFFVDQSWVAEAKFEFPLYEGGLRQAELTQARTRLNQDRLRTLNLKKQVELDVTRAYMNYTAISRELESREDQLRFARKNYEMISKQFTFGLVTNIDLLDANQTLIDAERDLISATYDRHLAVLDVQHSVGVFLPHALESAGVNL